MARAFFHFDR
jgi:hypothetical protein